ncbi:MAG TPA: FAD-binding oxidoreductase [Candidatus Limnocylindrales bacterium]|nr:FAD-binding oxidoreductase [Candidatus Limnocylindrales bacterium]
MPADAPPGDARPGGRRSWWLREALAAEPPALRDDATPPFAGHDRADFAILGGGYTGLWAALRLAELAPGARITVLERDVCGGGASGRNGGFVTGWWDELPALVERHGPADGLRLARAVGDAVGAVGAWAAEHGVDAWYRRDGFVAVSAAPAQDGAWDDAVEACAGLGVADEYVAVTADEVRRRVASPVFRAGVFMRDGATVQPARLARGLRRVALERGVVIHERTAVRPSGDLGQADTGGFVGRRTGGGVAIRTSSAAGDGVLVADQVIVALNAWAAAWPAFGRRLVTWSSYIVLTEPIPERLAEFGWTGGEGIVDARFTLHYARTTPDGRIALGGGGGRAGFGGRIGRAFTHDAGSAARAAAGLRRWFPSLAGVRIEDAWGGPIDITADHLPFVATSRDGRVQAGLGFSGNGVGPSLVVGRALAAVAAAAPVGTRAADDPWGSLPLVGALPRAFPPEPLRYLGARVIREAIVRRELAEEEGRRPGRVVAALSRLPRRLGYHLGPG